MTNAFVAEFYIASAAPIGGAILYGIDPAGRLEERGKIPMFSPGWTELDGGRICAAVRDPAQPVAVERAFARYTVERYALCSGLQLEYQLVVDPLDRRADLGRDILRQTAPYPERSPVANRDIACVAVVDHEDASPG